MAKIKRLSKSAKRFQFSRMMAQRKEAGLPSLNATRESAGFSRRSRPNVITRSGRNVFSNGKLVSSRNTEEEAQAYVDKQTAGYQGRISSIAGDKGGETFRQLYRTNKGSQTGQANTAGIKSAIQSRGYNAVTTKDADGNEIVSGGITDKTQTTLNRNALKTERANVRAYVRGQPFSRQAPVLRDQAKETLSKERIAKERGIDTKTASAGQTMLLNEAVNMDVYGMATPNFGTGANVISAQQKATEQSIDATKTAKKSLESYTFPEELITVPTDTSSMTSETASIFLDEQVEGLEDYNTTNAETVSGVLTDLIQTDPDIAQAQADGDTMQSLLEERQKFYEDEYNSLKEQITEIYDAKEEDYKEQAAVAMGSAVSQMANMGSFGVTSASMQYIDGVNRKNQAQIMALATEEAVALGEAYNAFVNADFGIAKEMMDNARNTRSEIRQLQQDSLNRKKQMMELRQMEREDALQTIGVMVKSGVTEEDLPEGYFEYLDAKSGYIEGMSKNIFRVSQAENYNASIKAQADFQNEQAKNLADILSKIPAGKQMEVNGYIYSSLNNGETVTGTEVGADGKTYLWSYNKDTGEYDTRDLGIQQSAKYTDIKSNEGAIIRVFDDGSSRIMFDPRQINGGFPSGGLIDAFPQGTMSPFTRSAERGGKKMATECGAWVNDTSGLGVGSTYASKIAKCDPSINASNAQTGDVFVTEYGTTGHIGYINSIFTDENGELVYVVSESNVKKDKNGYGLITHDRPIKASSVKGFARPGFNNPSYNFGTDIQDATSGYEGLTFGDEMEDKVDSKEATEKSIAILDNIKNLLSYDKSFDNATGPISSKLPTLRGKTADFEADFNNLLALLTLENLPLLKGPMSDKDIEFIKQASSGLTLGRSEEGLKEELNKIYKRISDKMPNKYNPLYINISSKLTGRQRADGTTLSLEEANGLAETAVTLLNQGITKEAITARINALLGF